MSWVSFSPKRCCFGNPLMLLGSTGVKYSVKSATWKSWPSLWIPDRNRCTILKLGPFSVHYTSQEQAAIKPFDLTSTQESREYHNQAWILKISKSVKQAQTAPCSFCDWYHYLYTSMLLLSLLMTSSAVAFTAASKNVVLWNSGT